MKTITEIRNRVTLSDLTPKIDSISRVVLDSL